MDTRPQLTIRFYISIETASTDTEIFFFDLTGSSVTESFVRPLVVIIPFDIFKNREANLFNRECEQKSVNSVFPTAESLKHKTTVLTSARIYHTIGLCQKF